jgi:hypothetical protein
MRYAVSIAGTSSTRDISELQIAPTLNVDFPERWFLTLYPSYDIRINYGDPISGQTGPLLRGRCAPGDASGAARLKPWRPIVASQRLVNLLDAETLLNRPMPIGRPIS